jgi:hypothetical protein
VNEIAPGWPITVEDSNDKHWVGACGDLTLVFAFEGSHDDLRHVVSAARLIEKRGRSGHKSRLLFATPPGHAKPPAAEVRKAIGQEASRVGGQLDRVALVVSGTGFGPAIHRGAIAGVLALRTHGLQVKVVGSLRLGVEHLLHDAPGVIEPILSFCEERLSDGAGRPHQNARSLGW